MKLFFYSVFVVSVSVISFSLRLELLTYLTLDVYNLICAIINQKMLSVGPGGRSLSQNDTCELPEAIGNLLFVHVRSYDL